MNARRLSLRAHRLFRRSRLLQLGLLFSFWLAGNAVVRATGLPLPGGIVGLAFVLAALSLGRLSILSVKRGADWLLSHMLLFFVPAALAVLDHREFVGLLGAKIVVVILVSTVAVMGVTALTVDLMYRWRSGNAQSAHPE